jgi:hypothetical protein
MNARYLLGVAAVALAIALTKLWLSLPGPEEPARGSSQVSFDSLYPEAADAALKARAQQPAE